MLTLTKEAFFMLRAWTRRELLLTNTNLPQSQITKIGAIIFREINTPYDCTKKSPT